VIPYRVAKDAAKAARAGVLASAQNGDVFSVGWTRHCILFFAAILEVSTRTLEKRAKATITTCQPRAPRAKRLGLPR
jgi:hypothetical protein